MRMEMWNISLLFGLSGVRQREPLAESNWRMEFQDFGLFECKFGWHHSKAPTVFRLGRNESENPNENEMGQRHSDSGACDSRDLWANEIYCEKIVFGNSCNVFFFSRPNRTRIKK